MHDSGGRTSRRPAVTHARQLALIAASSLPWGFARAALAAGEGDATPPWLLALLALLLGFAVGTVLVRRGFHRPADVVPRAAAAPSAPATGRDWARDLEHAEATLRERTARLGALLDTAVDAILTIDELGRIESINHATERVFGYTEDELIGKNVKILMPAPFHQEHDGYLANYRESGDKKIIGIGREVLARRKDGTVFPIDLAVNEVDQGGVRCFMGVVRDITERKEAEEAVRRERDFAENLLDTAPVIVMVVDRDGRIVRCNRFLETLVGRPRDGLIGNPWTTTLVAPRDRDQARTLPASGADPAAAEGGEVLTLVTASGEERQVSWVETLLHTSDGNVEGVLRVGVDISERIRLEEQFRRAEKMDAIGRLAGGIAHDFNTLLGSITGYSEMLLERVGEDPAQRRPAEQIYRCADRGAALTRQLLAFSRQHVVDPGVVDLGALLREMEDMLARLSGDDVTLELSIAGDTGAVHADAGQLEQVVMNLVVNAVDAMPRGGHVTLATDALEIEETCPDCGAGLTPGRYVRIAVRDTGYGMDDETRQRIFEPFFTTKEQGRGTGLGLSTVYGIVQQTGGCIGVDSEPGVGSVFRICLPAASPEAVEAAARSKPTDAALTPATDVAATDETVLLVDDDATFLELLEEVLCAKGYRVKVASGPREALDTAAGLEQPPDLLISDVVMPGMTGTDLARELARAHPSLRVLLMSGYNDEDLAARGAQSAYAAYIQKPFTTAELLRLVRDVLDDRATLGLGRQPGPPPAPGA